MRCTIYATWKHTNSYYQIDRKEVFSRGSYWNFVCPSLRLHASIPSFFFLPQLSFLPPPSPQSSSFWSVGQFLTGDGDILAKWSMLHSSWGTFKEVEVSFSCVPHVLIFSISHLITSHLIFIPTWSWRVAEECHCHLPSLIQEDRVVLHGLC